MKRSDLIARISKKLSYLSKQDVEQSVENLIGYFFSTLGDEGRIELRGFGSFSTRKRSSRVSRNPKTGESITVDSKSYAYFRSSKNLLKAINKN